jgi:hypothetical protein
MLGYTAKLVDLMMDEPPSILDLNLVVIAMNFEGSKFPTLVKILGNLPHI